MKKDIGYHLFCTHWLPRLNEQKPFDKNTKVIDEGLNSDNNKFVIKNKK